jgi:hypothetical protein
MTEPHDFSEGDTPAILATLLLAAAMVVFLVLVCYLWSL